MDEWGGGAGVTVVVCFPVCGGVFAAVAVGGAVVFLALTRETYKAVTVARVRVLVIARGSRGVLPYCRMYSVDGVANS